MEFFHFDMQLPKILIVEDDLFLRELYSDILSSGPWTLDTASDGQIGLEKIQKGGWDLILLDMNLPKMNGLEIVKKISENPIQPQNKKIVFLTNMEEGPVLGEIKKLGYEYLIKSQLAPDQFLQQIKAYLPQ